MSRLLACFTVLVLVSGGSLAASSTNVPPRAVLQSELPALLEGLPALSGQWSAMTLGQPVAEKAATEVIQVAGRVHRGANRNRNRNVNRNVNVNRRGGVVIAGDYDDDDHDHELGAAIIGMGVGAAIANSNQPTHTCSGSNCGY